MMKAKLIFMVLILSFGTLQSCKTPKDTVVEQTVTEEVVVTEEGLERFVGTVHMDETCGVTIRVIQGDVERYYSPSNLEEKFYKEGLKIRFNSVMTGTKMEGECSLYEIITLSEVSAVR